MDELDEDFCPELRGGAAENHQLYPLGDAIAQGNGSFHGGVLLHTAIYKVILIIRELGGGKKQPSGLCTGILGNLRDKSALLSNGWDLLWDGQTCILPSYIFAMGPKGMMGGKSHHGPST